MDGKNKNIIQRKKEKEKGYMFAYITRLIVVQIPCLTSSQ